MKGSKVDPEVMELVYEVQKMITQEQNEGRNPDYIMFKHDYGLSEIYGLAVIVCPQLRDGSILIGYNPAIYGQQIRRKEK